MDNKDVKSVDVYRLNEFVGQYVVVKLKNPQSERSGIVYTVDPVSESVLLLNRDQNSKLSVSIAMKHTIEEMIIQDEIPENLTSIDLSEIFTNRKTGPSRLGDPNMKSYVLKWLTISNVPFTVEGDLILVEGVAIQPPYGHGDCVSSYPVKLKSLQNLMRTVAQLVAAKDQRLISPSTELPTT